ncbi:MAG: hypothetical protein ACQXXH_08600 [Candidatus Bathyarchaeia archaeon]|jgi:ABC-type Zn uptake system ZnuABC Zn-binding protein ZnuA
MKTKLTLATLSVLISLGCAACGELSPAEIDAQAEAIAAPIVATWQAG